MTTETPASDEAAIAAADAEVAGSDHEVRHEVGEAPESDAAPQPQPVAAETPPVVPAADPDPATDPKAPKWYREHMAKTNRERAAERAELDRLRTAAPPAQQPRQQPVQLPNPAEDPEGYAQAIWEINERRYQQRELMQTLRTSERDARREYGGEAFEECRAWLTTRPDLEEHFLRQDEPWQEALAYYNRERLAEEIGSDPTAYKKRIEEEAIAKYVAQQGQQPSSGMTAAPQPQRAQPPLTASTVRSAPPIRDDQGRFSGSRPLRTRNNFG